jgi:hypothetical protein
MELRYFWQKQALLLKHGRLPTQKELQDIASVEHLYKKNGYKWSKATETKLLKKIMKYGDK